VGVAKKNNINVTIAITPIPVPVIIERWRGFKIC
jgi:hypothetical protein